MPRVATGKRCTKLCRAIAPCHSPMGRTVGGSRRGGRLPAARLGGRKDWRIFAACTSSLPILPRSGRAPPREAGYRCQYMDMVSEHTH
ncbi:hypothetical protein U9M48_039017 [Paspalum notatum var. saurae]|uniref:Uncharacterized protein n=1 Tax=Paspalum notatum var. saurae TaxID=547442 RepID=A0AAQ3UPD3_PASNO